MQSKKVLTITLISLLLLIVIAGSLYLTDQIVIFGSTPPLLTATNNPIQYYLSLPEGWVKGRRYPVLVTIDGSNKQFARNIRLFQRARGTRPYIIITPLVVSNGPRFVPDQYFYSQTVWRTIKHDGYEAFDEEGLLAILQDVKINYGGEAKFFMTGWSAGGRITWRMILKHPELLSGAVLSAANYGSDPDSFSNDPGRVNLPIKGLLGTADDGFASLNAQWNKAIPVANIHGYKNIHRILIAGAHHSPFAKEVFAFADSLRN